MFIVMVVCLVAGIHIGVSMTLAAAAALIAGDQPLILFVQKFYNTFESFPMLAVPFFILAGEIMRQGSMAEVLLNLARTLACHIRGGLAHISILTCLFYGALCGSAPATLAAVGGMMIKPMQDEGYPVAYAAAVNAAGGALGPLIPPSIALILFGASAGTSIADLFRAVIPVGLLVALAFLAVSYFTCKKHSYGTIEPRCPAKERIAALWQAKWAILVPVIVLGGIYGGFCTPTEAGCLAVVYAFFAETFITRTMTLERFKSIIVSSFKSNGQIMFVCCGAQAMGTILTFYNADAWIVNMVSSITTNPTILMCCFVVLFLILGMFMEVGACVLMLTPMLMPLVKSVGIDPIHFGIVFVTTMVVGVMTPPVGLNLYIGCAISDASFEALCKQILPYVFAMAVVCFVAAIFPGLCLFIL